jgi:hypothetical protein
METGRGDNPILISVTETIPRNFAQHFQNQNRKKEASCHTKM